jgi:non-ribosomal peptide synthetase component F
MLMWSIFLNIFDEEKNDILFGIVVSGRNIDLKRIENSKGIFINTLPFRLKKLNNLNLIELLKYINDIVSKINNNSTSSLHKIKKKYFENKKLFDTIFIFENYPIDEDLKKNENLPLKFKIIKSFEITEYLLSNFKNCYVQLNFFNNLINKNKIEKSLLIFKKMIKNENISPFNLSYLLKEEKILFIEFNKKEKINPNKNKTIQEIFEEQVLKTPNNISIIFKDEKLTYKQLNEKTN